jgi:hypothetical protein
MAKAVVVQKEGEREVPAQIIAQSIVRIADAAKVMFNSGLNEKAIVLLISDSSGVGRRDVALVLNHIYYLKTTYLVQPKIIK